MQVNAYHAYDHRNMRRNEHVGDGRNGYTTSYGRTGNVEHEESIMIGQSGKYIRKDSARDECKQSIHLKTVFQQKLPGVD